MDERSRFWKQKCPPQGHVFLGCVHRDVPCKCRCICGLTLDEAQDEWRRAREAAEMGWP